MRVSMLCAVLALSAASVMSKTVIQSLEATKQTGALAKSSQNLLLSEQEKTVLRGWKPEPRCSVTKTKALPKGQQKKQERTGQVSAGWQKKIARGEVLEAEVLKACRNAVPAQIVTQLPPAPPGTLLIEVDGRVIRLLEATREILDVFDLF